MNAHTDIQIIRQGGKPAFAVVPYYKWLEIIDNEDENTYIPHEVVGYQIKEGLSLIAAWRKYFKMTQKDLADKTGVTQSAIAQIEQLDARPRKKTVKKIAKALKLDIGQLTD